MLLPRGQGRACSNMAKIKISNIRCSKISRKKVSSTYHILRDKESIIKLPYQPGPKVIKLFSSSAQLSMKFQLLINADIVKISGKFRFISHKLVIYPANKC